MLAWGGFRLVGVGWVRRIIHPSTAGFTRLQPGLIIDPASLRRGIPRILRYSFTTVAKYSSSTRRACTAPSN